MGRKIFFSIYLVLLFLAGPVYAGPNVVYNLSQFTTFYESDDSLERGWMVYAPATVNVRGKQFVASARTAFTYNIFNSEITEQNPRFGALTDTGIDIAYKLDNKTFGLGKNTTILLSGNLNLPTGKEELSDEEAAIFIDPLLLDIDRFGEGFNIGTTAILTQKFPKLKANLSIGAIYINKGSYNPLTSNLSGDLDPGDRWGGLIRLSYDRSNWGVQASLRVLNEGLTALGDIDFFDRGTVYESRLKITNRFSAKLQQSVNLFYVASSKSERVDFTTNLLVEDENNASGDTIIADYALQWRQSRKNTFLFRLSSIWVEQNDFNDQSLQFLPGRTKVSGGLQYFHQLSPNIRVGLDGSYFQLKNDGFSNGGDVKYRGGRLGLSIKGTFQ